MSLFSKIFKKGPSQILALDIGTEVAKALVFEVHSKEEKIVVQGVAKTLQKIGNMQSGAVSDINGVIAVCQNTISRALQLAKVKKVKKAIIGIAGELVKGTTTTVHYERAKPETKIEMPELKNIIEKVQGKALERIKKQGRSMKYAEIAGNATVSIPRREHANPRLNALSLNPCGNPQNPRYPLKRPRDGLLSR